MIEWIAGSAFVLGVSGSCYAFYRTGYLRGWSDCAKAVRERQNRAALRKTFDLELERMRRRKR